MRGCVRTWWQMWPPFPLKCPPCFLRCLPRSCHQPCWAVTHSDRWMATMFLHPGPLMSLETSSKDNISLRQLIFCSGKWVLAFWMLVRVHLPIDFGQISTNWKQVSELLNTDAITKSSSVGKSLRLFEKSGCVWNWRLPHSQPMTCFCWKPVLGF